MFFILASMFFTTVIKTNWYAQTCVHGCGQICENIILDRPVEIDETE